MTDIPRVPAPRITPPRDQSTPTASGKRSRLPSKPMLSICLGQLVWMEYGLHGRIIGRSAMPSVEGADGNTDRADDRAVFSWTRTAATCLLGLSEDLRLCARGPRPSIDSRRYAHGPIHHIDDFYRLGTPTFCRQQHGRAHRDLRGHLDAILDEGDYLPSSPHPRIAVPSVDSDVPGLCPGAKQILLRSSSDQPDCHPSCQKSAMVLLAGSSPSALRTASDRDRSPTFHGGQRDEKCHDAAQ